MTADLKEIFELLRTLEEMGVKRTEYSIVSPWDRRHYDG